MFFNHLSFTYNSPSTSQPNSRFSKRTSSISRISTASLFRSIRAFNSLPLSKLGGADCQMQTSSRFSWNLFHRKSSSHFKNHPKSRKFSSAEAIVLPPPSSSFATTAHLNSRKASPQYFHWFHAIRSSPASFYEVAAFNISLLSLFFPSFRCQAEYKGTFSRNELLLKRAKGCPRVLKAEYYSIRSLTILSTPVS